MRLMLFQKCLYTNILSFSEKKKDLNQNVDVVISIDSQSTIEDITVQKLTSLEKLIKDDKSLKYKKKVEKKIWRVTV